MILGFDRGTYEREQRERLNKLNRELLGIKLEGIKLDMELLYKELQEIKNDIKDLKSSVLSIQERLNLDLDRRGL